MPKLSTGYAEIDRHPVCRKFPRYTYGVLWIVRDEWARMGVTAGTIRASRLEKEFRPKAVAAVRQKYGFATWVLIVWLIAKILITIWINKHSQEGCCNT